MNVGKKLASMDAISLLNLALIYKVCLLNGYVSIPVMNPSCGTSGKAKCICVACKLVDQYVSMKKYQRPCCGLQKQRLAKV